MSTGKGEGLPETWEADRPLNLESGETIYPWKLAYRTWGRLNRERDNVVVVCHSLTADTNVSEWWGPMKGHKKALDTKKYFIICINALGSPYGSTSPLTFSEGGLDPTEFPEITVRDVVRSQKMLTDSLGIRGIAAAVGGSLGGMAALEWGIMYPDIVKSVISIGSCAANTPWALGFGEVQRNAITNDPGWNGGKYRGQPPGLGLARKIAMISYRSPVSFAERFGRRLNKDGGNFAVSGYLDYHGKKLLQRFDANCYLSLLRTMDSHDVGRGRGGWVPALERLTMPALMIGMSTDALYPPEEQRKLAAKIENSRYAEIDSGHGHDAFLMEFEKLSDVVESFMGTLE